MAGSLRRGAAAAAMVGFAAVLAATTSADAQELFVCESEGRSLVFAGQAGAPGCSAVTTTGALQLSGAQPDLDAIVRALSAQSARIDRLEQLLLGARSLPARRPLTRPSDDPFDTQGRTRDLGQDIERRLEQLGD